MSEAPLRVPFNALRPGDSIDGPLVIEDPNSTVVILRGQTASIDKHKNILIEEKG